MAGGDPTTSVSGDPVVAAPGTPAPVPGSPAYISAAEFDVARQIRGLRRWLTVLTIVVISLPVLACGGCYAINFGMFSLIEGPSVTDTQVADAKLDVEKVWGSRLESVDVREVTVDYGGDIGPMPFLDGPIGGEKVGYLEYRVKGVPVTFSGVLQMEGTPGAIGLLPQMGSLSSQMTDEDVIALARAYAERGGKRIGGMASYFELMTAQGGPSIETTVVVGGSEYQLRSLWAVREGIEIEGDSVDADRLWGPTTRTQVFSREADGTYRYVGTESNSDWMMMSGF